MPEGLSARYECNVHEVVYDSNPGVSDLVDSRSNVRFQASLLAKSKNVPSALCFIRQDANRILLIAHRVDAPLWTTNQESCSNRFA